MSKTITPNQIELIKKLLRDRNKCKEIKTILDNLEENKALEDLKRLLRNKGKSSVLEKDIEEIIERGEEKEQ